MKLPTLTIIGLIVTTSLVMAIVLNSRSQRFDEQTAESAPECVLEQNITDATAMPDWSERNDIFATALENNDASKWSRLPFFWLDAQTDKIQMNQQFFRSLTPVNAIELSDDPMLIGSTHPALFELLSPRDVVMLLIETHIIRTYAHLDADVCLQSEEISMNGDYVAKFSAKHRYCTNVCEDVEYDFSVMIERTDGLISIAP